MDHSGKQNSATSSATTPSTSFVEAVLKAEVAQICDSIGYNAITQDTSQILVDIYQRTLFHLARHCKEAANNNRRNEATYTDLLQAFDFVGISFAELSEHIDTCKPLKAIKVEREPGPEGSNRIQRNLHVDDLLESQKNSHLNEQENGDTKDVGQTEELESIVPLLSGYQEISNKFSDVKPVTADKKVRLGGRIVLFSNTKLKISAPLPPEPTASSSANFNEEQKKKKKSSAEEPELKSSVKPIQAKKAKTKKLVKELPAQKGRKNERKADKKANKADKANKAIAVTEPHFDKVDQNDDEAQQVPSFSTKRIKIEPLAERKSPGLVICDETPFPADLEDARDAPFSPVVDARNSPVPDTSKAAKGKRKLAAYEEPTIEPADGPSPSLPKSGGSGGKPKKKKLKTSALAAAPLDLSIAEPPSFLSILERKPTPVDTTPSVPTPPPTAAKQAKSKKKRKAVVQPVGVVDSVAADVADKEYFCPACGKPDDGTVMLCCDSCQEWYHLGCTDLADPPGDDEPWSCQLCTQKKKKPEAPKKIKIETPKIVETPVAKITITKTPEPVALPSPAARPVVEPTEPAATTSEGISQDDLCPECNLPDDGTMMIQCDDPFCAKWFHGKCVNLLEEPKEDESWFCKACIDKQQSAFQRRRRAK